MGSVLLVLKVQTWPTNTSATDILRRSCIQRIPYTFHFVDLIHIFLDRNNKFDACKGSNSIPAVLRQYLIYMFKKPEGGLWPPSFSSYVSHSTNQTPIGFAFSGSILYCLIARATSFAFILPSLANAAIAACAM